MLLSLCGTTHYWSTMSNACVLCPANSTSFGSSCSCNSMNNYWHSSSNECRLCPQGSSYSNNSNSCTCVGNTYFDMLSGSCLDYFSQNVSGSSPWGIWRAQSYHPGIPTLLPEARGNGRNVDIGNIVSFLDSAGYGAINSVKSINGGTESILKWPTFPDEFTICSLTRYTNGDSDDWNFRQRILTNTDTGCDWFHGHHNHKRGVAFYNGWRTFEMSFGTEADWLVMCGQNSQLNSEATPKNSIADG